MYIKGTFGRKKWSGKLGWLPDTGLYGRRIEILVITDGGFGQCRYRVGDTYDDLVDLADNNMVDTPAT